MTVISTRLPSGFLLLSLVAILFSTPPSALSEGFRILDHGASATGQAAAFAAQADDPSAIHYNPAGMSQLAGIQAYIGTLFIGGNSEFWSAIGPTVDGGVDGTVAIPPPSSFFLTAHLPALGLERLSGWTAGIGVTIPYALQLDYPDDSLIAPIVTQAALPLLDIKPTLAYRLNDYISIGGGLDIYTFSGLFGEGQGEFQQKQGATTLEANGTDTALGFNAGLLLTPLRNEAGKPLVNLAFVYRNGADLNLKGDFRVNGALVADAATTVELPDVYTWAIAGWPIRNTSREWKIEVDVEYADWTDFEDLNLQLSNYRNPALQPVFGQTIPQPRNYQDSWIFLIGTEYRLLSPSALSHWDIAFRAGYIYSQTPIPDRTFEPAVPDADYHAPSVGMGFLCRPPGTILGILSCDTFGAKAIGLDLAYQVLLYDTRDINNNLQPVLNGKWDTTLHVGALSLRMNF